MGTVPVAPKLLAEEWWHFTLKDEPYPDRYFDFPCADEVMTSPRNREEVIENV